MIIPDFSREENLAKKGYKTIAGLDEAGRGPLAGPVVAAAVIFEHNPETIKKLISAGIRDSKTIAEKKRENLYDLICTHALAWSVGIVSEKIIDEINILNAAKLAMKQSAEKLSVQPDFLLIDGNATLNDFPADQSAVPKADAYILSVSAASILAKVTRDRIMKELDKKYPKYGFAVHKGYGTRFHMDILHKRGPCEIHRKTFEPIKSMMENGI